MITDKLSPLSENSHIMLTKEFTLEGVELLMVLDPVFTFGHFLLLIVPGFIAAIVYKGLQGSSVRVLLVCSYALIRLAYFNHQLLRLF